MFKNPCHCMFSNVSDEDCSHTGCLPYFYLIGAPQSETTDLWNNLVVHPYIIDIVKGENWWTRGIKTGE